MKRKKEDTGNLEFVILPTIFQLVGGLTGQSRLTVVFFFGSLSSNVGKYVFFGG